MRFRFWPRSDFFGRTWGLTERGSLLTELTGGSKARGGLAGVDGVNSVGVVCIPAGVVGGMAVVVSGFAGVEGGTSNADCLAGVDGRIAGVEDGLAGVLEGWIADIEVDLDGEDGDTEYLTGADVVLAGVERVDG